jgi:hypothetical protein
LIRFRRTDFMTAEVAAAKGQVGVVMRGVTISGVLFGTWLALLVPLVASRFAMSGDWIARTMIAVLFIAVALAIIRHRLWDISSVLIGASVWGLLVPFLPTVYSLLKGFVKSGAIATLGLLAIIYISRLPMDRLTGLAYRFVWRRKWAWQNLLKFTDQSIANSEAQSIARLFAEICPEKVSAAWLLEL